MGRHIKRGRDVFFLPIVCSQVRLSELPPPAVASPASGRPPVARARRATIQNTPQPKIPPNSEYSPTPKSTQFRKLPNSEYSPIQNTPQPKNPPNFSGLSKLRHGFSCFYWPEITAGDSHLEICSFQQTSYLSGKLFYGLFLCSVPWFWITLKDQNCHLNISFTRQLPKT